MFKLPLDRHPLVFLTERLHNVNFHDTVVIVPTNRNLRTLASMGRWQLDIQTVADFTRRAALFHGKLLPPELRSYFLYKASANLDKKQQIDMFHNEETDQTSTYIHFARRADAILPFFRELCAEGVSIQRLLAESCYSDHEMQVQILAKLWYNYTELVKDAGFHDEWELYAAPQLDDSYLKRYSRYIFLIGGYLSNYEISQLKTLSENYNVELHFNYTAEKHYQAALLEAVFNTDIENIGPNDVSTLCGKIQIQPCATELYQYDLVTARIMHEHIVNGIPFAKMAVILPSPEFATWFMDSDIYQLYNLSSGRSMTDFSFFQFFNCVQELLAAKTAAGYPISLMESLASHKWFFGRDYSEIFRRARRRGTLFTDNRSPETKEIFDILDIFDQKFISCTQIIKNMLSLLRQCMKRITGDMQEASRKAADELERLGLLYSIVAEEQPLPAMMRFLLDGLAKLAVPSSPGKVSVIGLLESRNMQYDYVFITDMNASSFGQAMPKDLYLNSEIRRSLGLPTFADRQELLKNYILQIAHRAKQVLFTYTVSEEDEPRRFITELLVKIGAANEKPEIYSPDYCITVPMISERQGFPSEDIYKTPDILAFLKSHQFSATSLNMYIHCPLKFYYHYVRRLTEPDREQDGTDIRALGLAFHSTLKNLHLAGISAYSDIYLPKMRQYFIQETASLDYFTKNAVGMFEHEALISRFDYIAHWERRRLDMGAETHWVEKDIKCSIKGVHFKGTIDRMDIIPGGYSLIDYKYKTIDKVNLDEDFDKMQDIQLPLYALLIEETKAIVPTEMLWFDLKNKNGFIDAFDPSRLKEFRTYLGELMAEIFYEGTAFDKAANKKECNYCPYTAICRYG